MTSCGPFASWRTPSIVPQAAAQLKDQRSSQPAVRQGIKLVEPGPEQLLVRQLRLIPGEERGRLRVRRNSRTSVRVFARRSRSQETAAAARGCLPRIRSSPDDVAGWRPGAAMDETSSKTPGEQRGSLRSPGVLHTPACASDTDLMYIAFRLARPQTETFSPRPAPRT